MTDEVDIYRAAKVVIDKHGDEAGLYAAARADEFLDKGDVEAASMWKLVLHKIDELLEVGLQGRTVH